MPYARRFPPPWTVEDKNNACFIVRDGDGQAVAYVYYEEEPGRRSAANLMTRDEAAATVRLAPQQRTYSLCRTNRRDGPKPTFASAQK